MDLFPSYKCNFDCPFCPVMDKQDDTLMDLDWLDNALSTIPGIKKFDIIGGEPSLLPNDYLIKLIGICSKYSDEKPQLYTNLKIISPLLHLVDPIISFDFDLRKDTNTVLNNILSLGIDYNINMIMTQQLVDRGAEYVLRFAKRFKGLQRLKISSFAAFDHLLDFTPDPQQLIDFVRYLIKHDTDSKIYFYPIEGMKHQYKKSISCEQLTELLPNNKFRLGTKDFHKIGPEFDTYDEIQVHYQKMMQDIIPDECIHCRYHGKCTVKYRDRAKSCYWDYKLMSTIEKDLSERI